MSTPHFHSLQIKRVTPEAAGAVAITLVVPADLHDAFVFKPGQFLTLKALINGASARRSYSICSSVQRYAAEHEIEIGVKPVAGGLFSNWAVRLQAGDTLDVMTPEGRFNPQPAPFTVQPDPVAPNLPVHRVAFVAGSGITPVLGIIASTLNADPTSRFTLVYANQTVNTVMFNEALQDLKDQYPARLALIYVFSRQAQDVALLAGRLDAVKVTQLLQTLLPITTIDEAFICGPEGMIDAVEQVLLAQGLARKRVHTERFFSPEHSNATNLIANYAYSTRPNGTNEHPIALKVVLDGKTHTVGLGAQDKLLDVALAAGLDLPYACRGGVCCTCRARVLTGQVQMEKNFTLEQWEIDKGFVLTCQARPLTSEVTVSFDER
jgi:ring-1,2-phenylacetyl-CoA epoxidase subunit PaaE